MRQDTGELDGTYNHVIGDLMRGVPVLTGLLLVVLAAAANGQHIRATNQTVTSRLEQSHGSSLEQVVYVSNRSSENIVLTSVRLMECENVQGSCASRRFKTKIPAGSTALVHRVRPRDPDRGISFRYTFTWELEAPEGPTAKDVARDESALEVDSVLVSPKVLDIKIGETLDLSQLLSIRAQNAAGQPLPRVFFYPRLELGGEYLTLEGTKITGLAPGTAALTISASVAASPTAPTKGAVQILVTVIP